MPQVNMQQLEALFGGPKYPTKEEILAEPLPLHKPGLIREIIAWKKHVWKDCKHDNSTKGIALAALVNILNTTYAKNVRLEFMEGTASPRYNPMTKTITMNETMSIISTMHEFAHALYGADEKKACRWSVHLFRKTFPRAYGQLVWQGHCLVKQF